MSKNKQTAQSTIPKGAPDNTLAAPTKNAQVAGSPAKTGSQSAIEPPTRKLEDMPFSEQLALLQKQIDEEDKLDREAQEKINKLQSENSDFI